MSKTGFLKKLFFLCLVSVFFSSRITAEKHFKEYSIEVFQTDYTDEEDIKDAADEDSKEADENENSEKHPSAESETSESSAENVEEDKENPESPSDEEQQEENPSYKNEAEKKEFHAEVIHKFGGGVTEIQAGQYSDCFFAAGEDGFITKYSYPSLIPDTWQISRLPIKNIAVHPSGKYIAAYESDGFSTHKISLWEWAGKKKVFAKRLSDSVTSLSWSGNGNYLFVGNRSLDGIAVLNISGVPQNIYSSPPGIVFLAATGEREKTIVTYGETGRLVYTDIINKKKLAEYKTENKLQNTNLIKNFTQIIGYKDNTVFVINASSGKTLKEYHASNAIFASKVTDSEPIWLERVNRKNEWIIKKGNSSSASFILPRSFQITCAKYLNSSIVIGGKNGELLLLKINKEKVEVTFPFIYNNVPVLNIASSGENIFFIAKNNIYSCNSPHENVSILAENISSNCLAVYEEGFILWSDSKTAPVYHLLPDGSKKRIIFRPNQAIISLSVYKKNIAVVEAFGDVSIIEIESGKKLFSYSAAGIQSAAQIDEEYLLISKSSTGKTQFPIFKLSIFTKETTPIHLDGELALSLTQDKSEKNAFFCFLVNSSPSGTTNLIRFKIGKDKSAGNFEKLLTYEDEDLEAFIAPAKNGAITNFGKENLIFFDTRKKQGFKIQRDSALPKKAAATKNFILSLNFDGSLSWYGAAEMKFIKNVRYAEKTQN